MSLRIRGPFFRVLFAAAVIAIVTATAHAVDFKLRKAAVIGDLMLASADLSPDGKLIAIAGTEGAADLQHGQMSLSASGAILIVDATSFQVKSRVAQGAWPDYLAFDAGGTMLTGLVDHKAKAWTIDGKPAGVLASGVDGIVRNAERSVALFEHEDGTIDLFDLTAKRLVRSFAKSPLEGKLVTAGLESNWIAAAKGQALVLFDLGSGKEVAMGTLPAEGEITMARIDSGGKLLAVSQSSGAVSVWSLADKTKVAEKHVAKSRVNALAFMGNSALLYGGVGNVVYYWSFAGEPAHFAAGKHTLPLREIVLSPSLNLAVTAGFDGVRVFEIRK